MKTALISLLFICLFFTSEVLAHPSWAIVVDDKNQVYVSDLAKIWKLDSNGKVSIFAERHTHEMTFDKNGDLLGEELHYEPSTEKFTASLWKITPNGEFSYILAPTQNSPIGISIWKNQAGATYYSGLTETEPPEYFLLKRNANGTVKVLLGDSNRALRDRQVVPYSLGGMFFAPDNSLYVKNGANFWKVATNDKVSLVADKNQISAAVQNPTLFGIAVDADYNVFTADFDSKKVLKITPDKKISAVYQSEPTWSPTGVYHKNKDLYVLESKNVPVNANPISRVRKIDSGGKISTLGTIGENQTNQPANNQRANFEGAVSENQTNRQTIGICAAAGLFVFAAAAFWFFGKENAIKI